MHGKAICPILATYVFLANLLLSGFLTGVIWYVQIVHYPQFADVGEPAFRRYHARHSTLTTYVVAAPMVAELALAVALIFVRPAAMPRSLALLAAALAGFVWIATFFVSVPLHGRLDQGYDDAVVRRLVRTNWLRTLAWTASLALLTYACIRVIG